MSLNLIMKLCLTFLNKLVFIIFPFYKLMADKNITQIDVINLNLDTTNCLIEK